MLLSIKKSGDNLLYAMCDGVVKTSINEKGEFCLHTCKKARYDELNDVVILAKLKEFLSMFSQMSLVVVFEEPVDKNQESIDFLKSKFGDKLVVL